MSLKDALAAGLNSVPDCQTVCYVDMSSGLVLASSSKAHRPQELYDQIGALAAQLLESASLAGLAANAAGDAGGDQDRCILVFGSTHTHAFVRSKTFREHAVCYMCTNTPDPDALSASIMESRETVANAM